MKKILLVFSFVLISLAGFSQNPYTAAPYDPLHPYAADGGFLRNHNTGQIYLVMEGKLRYIQTAATLNGLFIGAADNLVEYYTPSVLYTFPLGTDVSQASGFIRHTTDQRVYLREGTLLRWISTIGVANLYHFKLSIAQDLTSLAGYTIGSPIVN